MGLCTSKSTVTLDPSVHTMHIERVSRAAAEWDSPEGTPILDEGILMVQPAKSKYESGGTKSSRVVNQAAKGYLELGGKGGVEGDAQTSRETEEEEDDDEGNGVEELIFSDSDDSLKSEFLELS